jgi:hypothetical protein
VNKIDISKPRTRNRADGILATLPDGTEKYLHRVIAENAIGKELPKNSIVHHIDGDPRNNINTNLIILQSPKEHGLLHGRMKNKEKSWNPRIEKLCPICMIIKPLAAFGVSKHRRGDGFRAHCRACYNNRARIKKALKKASELVAPV